MRPLAGVRSDQTGSSTTELVLLMPVVLLLVLLIVQFGLWLHARQVVATAAQEGAATAQKERGTAGAGRARAEAFLAEAGGIRSPQVQAQRSDTSARVSVQGVAPAALPGMAFDVEAIAEGPVERFVPEPQR
ncbi:MAG: pilus assembly protein [Actinomycetota bacterium]|nr:pilus assembly protein [Actinomycetota bacterium]